MKLRDAAMKTACALTLSLLLLAGGAPARAAWPVAISVCAIDGGQAVVVGANSTSLLCVTASHVAPAVGKPITARWRNGRTDVGAVVKVDAEKHLAAFTLPNRGDRLPFALGGAGAGPLVGFSFDANGRLGGFRGTFARTNGPTTFWMTGRNKPGDSGGAVFNENSEQLVGIQAARRETGAEETLAVSGQTIRGFVGEFVGGVVGVDPKTLDGALTDPTIVLTTCNRFAQRLTSRNKFNFASNNVNVNNNVNNLELAFQLDTLLAQVQFQEQTINNLQTTINNIQGQAGSQGLPGERGEQGEQGEPGVVDYEGTIYPWIVKWIKENWTTPPGPVAPLTVNFLDGEGQIARTEAVTNGQINIPPVRYNWQRLNGETDKRARVLGDALDFETIPAKIRGAK